MMLVAGIILSIHLWKKKKEKMREAIENLSDRELAVAILIQSGKQNKEIAEELYISISTVKTHVNNIYKKLGVQNRKEFRKINFPQN
jgi:DNA-binding NarL/FixJ family response regulator